MRYNRGQVAMWGGAGSGVGAAPVSRYAARAAWLCIRQRCRYMIYALCGNCSVSTGIGTCAGTGVCTAWLWKRPRSTRYAARAAWLCIRQRCRYMIYALCGNCSVSTGIGTCAGTGVCTAWLWKRPRSTKCRHSFTPEMIQSAMPRRCLCHTKQHHSICATRLRHIFRGAIHSSGNAVWNAQHVMSCAMALPKALRLLLMCFASSKRSPVASLLPTLSLPAQGIRCTSRTLLCSESGACKGRIYSVCLGDDITIRSLFKKMHRVC